MARVVAVGEAHHITQRGIARQAVFTSDKSRHVYLELLREYAALQHLRVLGYCLMTNHVHLLAIPEREDSLATTLRYVHGRFAQYANVEMGRNGHFWQNRFYSCPVEEPGTASVLAYIELNPVRAGLTSSAEQFEWSSAAIHLGVRSDSVGLLDLNWWKRRWTEAEWSLALEIQNIDAGPLRRATYTGRPLGSEAFVADLERRLRRRLQREKGGRPKQQGSNALPGQDVMVA